MVTMGKKQYFNIFLEIIKDSIAKLLIIFMESKYVMKQVCFENFGFQGAGERTTNCCFRDIQ